MEKNGRKNGKYAAPNQVKNTISVVDSYDLYFVHEKIGDRVRLWKVKKSDYQGKEGIISGRKGKNWLVTLEFNGKVACVGSKRLQKVTQFSNPNAL